MTRTGHVRLDPERRAWLLEHEDLLDVLSWRERLILSNRYGLEGRDPRALRELASIFGISPERTKQIVGMTEMKLHGLQPGRR